MIRPTASTDQRGNYAVFIAVIVTALLFMGGLAYDGPRLIAARQDAAHAANEAARVAAATIASGGSLQQAQAAAQRRADETGLIYGQDIDVIGLDCVGSRVQASIASRYVYS
ncbi:MAG: pilus assembly protein TadG-related protein, partial [bacterium]|nr:pilus assembly protein TadG-related protein [bacterium]